MCAPPRSNAQLSSHGFGIAEAINFGRILKLLPRTLRVYGIEGKNFGIGETGAPEVLHAVEQVAQQIAQLTRDVSVHNLQINSSRS